MKQHNEMFMEVPLVIWTLTVILTMQLLSVLFLSKNHLLHYQAGAGIVADSIPESELQEVYNKLGALDKALTLAENI